MRSIRTAIGITAGALAFGLLGASPATAAAAAGSPGATPSAVQSETVTALAAEAAHPKHRGSKGKVVARSLNIRKKPTTYAKVVGSLHKGEIVKLDCKVKSKNVKGNEIWYRLDKRYGWVAARYVKNLDYVPWCGRIKQHDDENGSYQRPERAERDNQERREARGDRDMRDENRRDDIVDED